MRFGGFSIGSVPGATSLNTYRCSFAGLNAAAGDAVELRGNATTTSKLLAFQLAKPNASVVAKVVKRSAFSTAGASTSGTIVPLSSGNPAASSVVKLYTGAPTPGAEVGILWQSPVNAGDLVWETFGDNGGQNAVLANNEAVVLVLSGAVSALYGYFEWVEV